MQLRVEETALAELGEACRRIIAPMADKGAVRLSFAIPGGMPKFLLDPMRFKQALLNVISNAVKFTPHGGHVSLDAALEGGNCVLVIRDTGIGMKAEDIALAMQPFRQVDSALNRRFEGTGLGLPLAKALLELHGARIAIESVPDVGTTVRIYLPLNRLSVAA
jgi:two-component system cell cycle sensor histidine kinase PleC